MFSLMMIGRRFVFPTRVGVNRLTFVTLHSPNAAVLIDRVPYGKH